MSATPRTDALKIPSEALLLLGQKGIPEQIVKAILTLGDHARQLETELQLKTSIGMETIKSLEEARKELTNARAEYDEKERIAEQCIEALEKRIEAIERAGGVK